MNDKFKNNMHFSLLPKRWILVGLGDVIKLIKGKKPKNLGDKSETLQFPYINIEAFEFKRYNQFTDGKDCPTCEPDDILIVWDGARCGLVGRGVKGVIGSTLAKLDCGEIHRPFLFYFLQTKYEYINKHPRGVGIPHVEPNLFWNILLPLPPLSEQHRIVAKIEELFTKLDAGVEALKRAKDQIKAVLKYAFEGKLTEEWREANRDKLEPASVLLEQIKEEQKKKLGKKYKDLPPVDISELPKLPEGWMWGSLGEISDDIQYGYTAKAINEPIGPKMLRITDIQENNVDWNNVPYCVIEPNEEKKYLLNEGDLVFARTGATVGKSFLIKGKIPKSIFASYLIRIVLSKNVFKEYVFNFFQSYEYWKQILSNQLGIGQPNVNSQILSKIILPLPPLPEQHRIVEEIERRLSIADATEKTIDQCLKQAERLRQSILKTAFEGKLVPQDPNDEPAEKLLERIKVEKEKQSKIARSNFSNKSKRNGKK